MSKKLFTPFIFMLAFSLLASVAFAQDPGLEQEANDRQFEASILLGELNSRNFETPDAWDFLQQANNAFDEGMSYFNMGDWQPAIDNFNNAIFLGGEVLLAEQSAGNNGDEIPPPEGDGEDPGFPGDDGGGDFPGDDGGGDFPGDDGGGDFPGDDGGGDFPGDDGGGDFPGNDGGDGFPGDDGEEGGFELPGLEIGIENTVDVDEIGQGVRSSDFNILLGLIFISIFVLLPVIYYMV